MANNAVDTLCNRAHETTALKLGAVPIRYGGYFYAQKTRTLEIT